MADITRDPLVVHAGPDRLQGRLVVPDSAQGLVVFVHGSGSSRHSPRNRHVADRLQQGGFASLLFDLLTPEEDLVDRRTRHLRFDIGLLTRRVVDTLDWLSTQDDVRDLPIGLFGASTGAAAAIVAATRRPERVTAVVSRGGRPDLAGDDVARIQAPTLLIVGGDDETVLELNRRVLDRLPSGQLHVVPGATHLFEEPGALSKVVDLAIDWFAHWLPAPAPV